MPEYHHHCWKHSFHSKCQRTMQTSSRATQYNNNNSSNKRSRKKIFTIGIGNKMLKKTYNPPSFATPIRTPSTMLALISLSLSLHSAPFFFSLAHANTNKIVIIFPVSIFSHAIRRAFVLQNNYFCLTITFLPLTRIENVYLWLHIHTHRTHKIILVHIFFSLCRISWHYLLLLSPSLLVVFGSGQKTNRSLFHSFIAIYLLCQAICI